MSTEPQLFRVDPDAKVSVKVAEVDFSHLGLQERRDIQEWVVEGAPELDDAIVERTATSLARMIETITTEVEGFFQSHNPDASA